MALAMFAISPIIGGCFFANVNLSCDIDPLLSPQVTLFAESKCITWDTVQGAAKYLIYCNDELVGTIDHSYDNKIYKYEFGDCLTDIGDYEIYVVAQPKSITNASSYPSDIIEYRCDYVTSYIPGTVSNVVEESSILIPLSISGATLTFNPLENMVDGYELYCYSSVDGLRVYPLDISTLMASDGSVKVNLLSGQYNLKDTIYAIRVGVITGESNIVVSETTYLNPDHQGEYTDQVYIFDGYINDRYIKNLDELRNYIYYNFVHRIADFTFKISPSFSSLLHNYYSQYTNNGDSAAVVMNAVIDTFNHFMETREGYSIGAAVVDNANSREFRVKIDFLNPQYLNNSSKPEPRDDVKPSLYYYDEIEWSTFYDTCGYTMRIDDNNYAQNPYVFESDKQFLKTEVESSEELYWAIENKITPICLKDSKAESIYADIKETLNNIISDQMTDYEKVLSIYDWICANTSYDYYALIEGAYNYMATTLVPGFYLEGVFDTGYAVCDGFSKAFSLMCNMEGLDAIRVVGHALRGEDENGNKEWGGHAWNKIKLDVNPLDEIPAQYYIVDITWTEMIGSYQFDQDYAGGDEVSSHEYFLVDDDYIAETHRPYANRKKFEKLKTGERFSYYENTYFTFNPRDYNLVVSSSETQFDLVIKSSDELVSAFYYLLINNLETLEVVIDYDYMKAIQLEVDGKITNYERMINNLKTEMQKRKFLVQYISLRTVSVCFPLSVYNEAGSQGVIMVMENNLLIDSVNENGRLVDFLSHYGVYGEYELYVTNEMLNIDFDRFSYLSILQRKEYCLNGVRSLFASSLNTSNISMTFDLLSLPQGYEKSDKTLFRVKISPKS